MQYKSKILSTLGISIVASLFIGCGGVEPAPYIPPKDEGRAQELQIEKSMKTKATVKQTKSTMQVSFDNITNSKADLILKNNGDKTLTLDSVKLIDNTGLFKMGKNCGSTISGKDSCKLEVEFTGVKEGRYNAVIEIVSNDRSEKIKRIDLFAEAKNKFHGAVEAIDTSIVAPQKTVELKFNALNKTQYVKLRNDGLDTLSLKQPVITGSDKENFEIAESSCGNSLAIGQECQVTVNYLIKKDGYSDAKLYIPSNGDISPSQYINLEGFSKPFSVEIAHFVVSKNIQDFMDDYFETNSRYYFRTIFQQKTDRAFKENVDKEIQNYFSENGYKMVANPSDADKIITIYPSVQITRQENKSDLKYDITVNGQLVTKAKVGQARPLDENGVNNVNIANENNQTSFGLITTNNLFHDKEKFEFGMVIDVTSVSDERDVAQTIADMMTSSLFNVIGLKDTKGN